MNEGPGYYLSTSQRATHFEEEDVPPLLRPGVGGRLVTFVVALNGTGPDAPNDWDQDYEHVLLDFAIDPGNTILGPTRPTTLLPRTATTLLPAPSHH